MHVVTTDLEIVPLGACAADDTEKLLKSCAVSRFLAEGPYTHGDAHDYFAHLVRADAARDDAVAWAARSGRTLRGLAVVRFPAWDRDHFGFVVARLEHLQTDGLETARALARRAVAELSERGVTLCSARLSNDALDHVEILEDEGFRYRELTLSPWRDLRSWQVRGFGVTRAAEPGDAAAIAAVARRAFRTDRFHRDGRVAAGAADGVYEKWVATWLARGDPDEHARVLVVDGEVAGFFLFDLHATAPGGEHSVARLVLDAVDPREAGRGHGYRMYCDVLDEASALVPYAATVVSAANPAVVNLYAKLGFRLTSGGEVTLHRWAQRPGGE